MIIFNEQVGHDGSLTTQRVHTNPIIMKCQTNAIEMRYSWPVCRRIPDVVFKKYVHLKFRFKYGL